MVIDTPGIDDEGELGALRVKKSYQVLNKTDIGVLVIDSTVGKGPQEEALVRRFRGKKGSLLLLFIINAISSRADSIPPPVTPPQNTVFTSARPGTSTFRS